MDVSVIMINYNTFDLTRDALESIFTHTEGIEFEIILIDNASPDGSGEKLRDLFGEKIVYIQAGANLGTSKAFNIGLKQSKGKYILWLNTDILMKENFIKKLYDYMESDPNCGICGGNILDFNGKPAHSYCKEFPDLKTLKKTQNIFYLLFCKAFRRRLFDQYNYSDRPIEVGYITGADMMIRRELFDRVGQFDEDIFMYGEETEFTYRVRHQTDMTVMSVPSAKIYHLEGASFSRDKAFSASRYRLVVSGTMIMYQKCFGRTAGMEYLKIIRRGRIGRRNLSLLLLKKNLAKKYSQQREVLDSMISQWKQQEFKIEEKRK